MGRWPDPDDFRRERYEYEERARYEQHRRNLEEQARMAGMANQQAMMMNSMYMGQSLGGAGGNAACQAAPPVEKPKPKTNLLLLLEDV